MAKLKKILLMGVSYVLIAALAIGGTLAYLQDEDSAVNVMTLGNVYIKQHEYERVLNEDGTYEMVTSPKYGEGYKLQPFTQGKPILPATGKVIDYGKAAYFDQLGEGASGGQRVIDGLNNIVDKFVLVENTGKTSAYVRTLIAIEVGSTNGDLIMTSTSNNWTVNDIGIIDIDGNNYFLMEAVYTCAAGGRHTNGVLPAGDYTYCSLAQVYIKNEATNDDMVAIDGNGNGTLDIIVLSQAVQAAGFENAETALDVAFGNVTTENHPWNGKAPAIPTIVNDAESLVDALANGIDVVLGSDVALGTDDAITVAKGANANINLNGYTLTGTSETTGKNRNFFVVKGDLTVSNGTVEMTHTGDNMGWGNSVSAFSVEGGKLTLDNVTIDVSGSDMAYGVDVNTTLGQSVLNVNNSTIKSNYTAVRIFNNHKTAAGIVNVNSGILDGGSRDIWAQIPSASAIAENAIVNIADGYSYEITVQESGGKIYQFN